MPMVKKTDSLSQGIFCCLHNTKHEICWDKKVEIIENYMWELKASQYSVRDRNEILRSGINWYEKLQKMDSEGIRPFLGARIINEQKETETRWRRKQIGVIIREMNMQLFSLFPPTPKSTLLKMLQKSEKENMIGP